MTPDDVVGTVEGSDATLAIVDGRMAMTADGDVGVYVKVPDPTPLSQKERHATLKIAGDDYRAKVELDAEGLDALADALYHAQEECR